MNSTVPNVRTKKVHSGSEFLVRAFHDVMRFPVSENREVLYNPATGASHTMPMQLSAVLVSCRKFATLDQHAENIGKQFGVNPADMANVREQLTKLAGAGMMVSEASLLKHFDRDVPSVSTTKLISTIAIPTFNRPKNLRKCLETFIEANKKHERETRFLVADDSDKAEAATANRELVAELRTKHGVKIEYLGKAEKAKLVEAIAAKSGVDTETVLFALTPTELGVSTGANRNAILLSTIDELIVQTDDDTSCEIARTPGQTENLTITSKNEPSEFWFGGQEPKFEPQNILALHEQLLGKGLQDCVKESESKPEVSDIGSLFLRRMGPTGGRVVITTPGSTGDSGLGNTLQLMTLTGESRKRLLADEETYRKTLSSSKFDRSATTATISDGTACVTTNIGMDNTFALPPFMPVHKSSQGIFGLVTKFSAVEGFMGYLPWMVAHQSPDFNAGASKGFAESALQLKFSELLAMYIRSISIAPLPTSEGRLNSLGRALVEIGSLDLAEFEERTKLVIWQESSKRIAGLYQILQVFQAQPDFWANDIKAYLENLQTALPMGNYAIPTEMRHLQPRDAYSSMRDTIRKFGELLLNWTAIRKAAKELKESGYQFGSID